MQQQQFDCELELAHGFTVRQVEERLEMGVYCCDPQYDNEGNYEGCCGVTF
jgi:hypothetical protein